jgi:hypothetical protein
VIRRPLVVALLAAACARTPPPKPPRESPPPSEPKAAPGPVEYEAKWKGLSFGTYLAPKEGLVADDGGFDAVFMFHGGAMADKEIRASGINAVFAASTFGIGSIHYNDAFQSPERFGHVMNELARAVGDASRKKAHVRRAAIIAWSAGFGAPQKILAQKYDDVVDTVFLLDGIHAGYLEPASAKKADPRYVSMFIKFAKAAVEGRKLMVITHSSVLTPDYATSKETTAALLEAVGVQPEKLDNVPFKDMHMILRADAGNLHVRGFSGMDKKDHVQHLYLVGDFLRDYLAPRWAR